MPDYTEEITEYSRKRIYLMLPGIKSWDWVIDRLRAGRDVVLIQPGRYPWRRRGL
jgi:hypothetical protein